MVAQRPVAVPPDGTARSWPAHARGIGDGIRRRHVEHHGIHRGEPPDGPRRRAPGRGIAPVRFDRETQTRERPVHCVSTRASAATTASSMRHRPAPWQKCCSNARVSAALSENAIVRAEPRCCRRRRRRTAHRPARRGRWLPNGRFPAAQPSSGVRGRRRGPFEKGSGRRIRRRRRQDAAPSSAFLRSLGDDPPRDAVDDEVMDRQQKQVWRAPKTMRAAQRGPLLMSRLD